MSFFDVILHPTDFSVEADEAFRVACAIARDHFSQVVVVHVASPSTSPIDDQNTPVSLDEDPDAEHVREEFARMKSLAADVPVTFRLVRGYPVGMILNVAHEEDADLIVIASSRRKSATFQLHGSVAEGVLRQAHCPVCCLRQPVGVCHPACSVPRIIANAAN